MSFFCLKKAQNLPPQVLRGNKKFRKISCESARILFTNMRVGEDFGVKLGLTSN